jgi:hypothetical protein
LVVADALGRREYDPEKGAYNKKLEKVLTSEFISHRPKILFHTTAAAVSTSPPPPLTLKTASYIWFLQLYLRGANSPAEHHRTGGMTDRMERRTGTMKYDKEADGIWKMLVWAVGHGISC